MRSLIAAALIMIANACLFPQNNSQAARPETVDMNTATIPALMHLPGMTAARARAIAAHRPYSGIADLRRAGIPENQLKKWEPLITFSLPKEQPGPGDAGEVAYLKPSITGSNESSSNLAMAAGPGTVIGPVRTAAPDTAASSNKAAGSREILTNENVISLVKAGVDKSSVVAVVKRAPRVNFDLTAHGVIGLTEAHVDPGIISTMRERVRAEGSNATGASGAAAAAGTSATNPQR